MNKLNCMKCKRVCIIAMQGWNISLDCVCHSIHTCMSCKLLRHCFCKCRVNNRNIRRDIEISKRILNTIFIVCNNAKSSNLCCCAWSRWNSTEFSLCTKCWETKWCNQILKACVWIFIKYPHSFCCVNRRTAAHCNNPIRLKFCHSLCTTHNCINTWVWLNIFKKLNLHTCFFKVINCFIKETVTLHRATTDNNDSSLSC